MIYLFNSPVLTAYGLWQFSGPLRPEEARQHLAGQDIRSAIGHQASADLLTQLLGMAVPVRRVTARMQAGDGALVLRVLQRLPEGQVLDAPTLQQVDYELGWLHCLQTFPEEGRA